MQIQKFHKAKKSLGQNFLKSEPALRKIVEEGEITPDDIILEIGPGKGALTEKLLECARCVIAIEKDKSLVEFLQEKFSEEIKNKKLFLLNEDILEIDISKILQDIILRTKFPLPLIRGGLGRGELTNHDPLSFSPLLRGKGTQYKIIANIPYNITGAILKKFLTEKNQPSMMVLMVQHEVAKRIIARDNKESILSVSVKAYGTPKLVMKVPARYFSPAPKVDSAIISIKNISRKNFPPLLDKERAGVRFLNLPETPLAGVEDFEKRFWETIHAGFAHKRKKLSNNLKKYIGKTYVMEGKDYKNMRAEDLTLEDWILLTKN